MEIAFVAWNSQRPLRNSWRFSQCATGNQIHRAHPWALSHGLQRFVFREASDEALAESTERS
jgi:hypothetical protein